MMESPALSPVHVDSSSRPSLGFPLGSALLLIIIFSLSGIFSCCYHWEKLRALRQAFSREPLDADSPIQSSPSKPKIDNKDAIQYEKQSMPVLMPGEDIPRFMALPCPCEPSKPEKIIVRVEKPPKPTSLQEH